MKITYEEFIALARAQGVTDVNHVAFKCCMCGTIQSMASLIEAGALPDQAENCVGYSCVGRWLNSGPPPGVPGKGCDWTLGGLFGSAGREVLEIVRSPTHTSIRFLLATPEEAQRLMKTAKRPVAAKATDGRRA